MAALVLSVPYWKHLARPSWRRRPDAPPAWWCHDNTVICNSSARHLRLVSFGFAVSFPLGKQDS
jgi:hypothetical protein